MCSGREEFVSRDSKVLPPHDEARGEGAGRSQTPLTAEGLPESHNQPLCVSPEALGLSCGRRRGTGL